MRRVLPEAEAEPKPVLFVLLAFYRDENADGHQRTASAVQKTPMPFVLLRFGDTNTVDL